MQAWHWWIILAVFLAIVEVFTPGFVVMCFSVGALLAALVAGAGLGTSWQVVGFAVGTFLAFISVRPLFQKWAQTAEERTATNVDRLIGQKATVLQDTNEDSGLVKVGGEEWPARAADGQKHSAGDKVVIERVEGNRLYVKSLQTE
ncbi:MAG: NfeD family protein [candidate division KSB1 bacterium]|nr:NfeD family protein [candidate division KSB1 bacterium]MDQ7066219.1 NfeD family protein [candidate division KSB1 bacterium]